jgi:hypothetical protein
VEERRGNLMKGGWRRKKAKRKAKSASLREKICELMK